MDNVALWRSLEIYKFQFRIEDFGQGMTLSAKNRICFLLAHLECFQLAVQTSY